MLVDQAARLEDLAHDWPAICARLGVDVDLPLSNHNMHPPHRDVLSGAARATLERAFADDLDRFGYDW